MTGELETISVTAPVDDLVPLFRSAKVAIVQDGTHFLGIITKVDLINHMRRKLG